MNTYINSYEFASLFGEKIFELHHSDILNFNEKIDVLVVSAFANNYMPTPGTLIGSLWKNAGLSVEKLSLRPFIDMRDEKGIWISQKLNNCKFQYILCVEFKDLSPFQTSRPDDLFIRERLKNMFSCLEILEKISPSIHTVAMPLLGAGNQRLNPAIILSALFHFGSISLKNCSNINKVYIIERKKELIPGISHAMDHVLNRNKQQITNVFQDKDSAAILKEISDLINQLFQLQNKLSSNETLNKLLISIYQENVRYLDIAILSRRTMELLLQKLNPAASNKTLYVQIQEFSKQQLASNWIISYMHILRILGNEQAHETYHKNKLPGEIQITDQRIMLLCLKQLFIFWIQYLSTIVL